MAITLWVRVEFSSSQVAALHQHNISTKHTVCKSVARHPSVYWSLDVQQKIHCGHQGHCLSLSAVRFTVLQIYLFIYLITFNWIGSQTGGLLTRVLTVGVWRCIRKPSAEFKQRVSSFFLTERRLDGGHAHHRNSTLQLPPGETTRPSFTCGLLDLVLFSSSTLQPDYTSDRCRCLERLAVPPTSGSVLICV